MRTFLSFLTPGLFVLLAWTIPVAAEETVLGDAAAVSPEWAVLHGIPAAALTTAEMEAVRGKIPAPFQLSLTTANGVHTHFIDHFVEGCGVSFDCGVDLVIMNPESAPGRSFPPGKHGSPEQAGHLILLSVITNPITGGGDPLP